jgi:hypothetical protein
MFLNKEEQMKLIRTIEDEVGSLGDYLYPDKDAHVNASIARVEAAISMLKNSYLDPHTYIALKDNETGEIEKRFFEAGDVGMLCYNAAQHYAWRDCDDTYSIVEIMCGGRPLEYLGWQPDMLFEFCDKETREIVYSANFPMWDH